MIRTLQYLNLIGQRRNECLKGTGKENHWKTRKNNMFEEQNILVSELFIKKIIERCWGELYDVNGTSKFKDENKHFNS